MGQFYGTRGPNPKPIRERMLALTKIGTDNECWLWRGHRIKRGGYGQISVKVNGRRTVRRAHKVAWELAHNTPVPAGLVIRHTCDVTNCVNPRHLILGTQVENLADMRAKGRGSPPPDLSGTKHPLSKLTPQKIKQARAWKAEGLTYTDIGKRLGVSRQCVSGAVRGLTYKRSTEATKCLKPIRF